MKTITKQLSLLLVVALLTASCWGNKKRGHRKDFLPPIKIEIPDVIKSDAELTDLVKESEKAINEFSDNMEYLIDDIKPYKDIDFDKASTFEKMKITKIGVEFFANSAKGLTVLEKLSGYAEKRVEQEKPLTDEQIKAMAVIYDTFEARMKQLDGKYKEFGGKKQ